MQNDIRSREGVYLNTTLVDVQGSIARGIGKLKFDLNTTLVDVQEHWP